MSASTQGEGGELPLPEGWASAFSQKHGKVYYYDRLTRNKTWDRPAPTISPPLHSSAALLPSPTTTPLHSAMTQDINHVAVSASEAGEWQVEADGDWSMCDDAALEAIKTAYWQPGEHSTTFDAYGFRYTLELGRGMRQKLATGKYGQLRFVQAKHSVEQAFESSPAFSTPVSTPAKPSFTSPLKQSLLNLPEPGAISEMVPGDGSTSCTDKAPACGAASSSGTASSGVHTLGNGESIGTTSHKDRTWCHRHFQERWRCQQSELDAECCAKAAPAAQESELATLTAGSPAQRSYLLPAPKAPIQLQLAVSALGVQAVARESLAPKPEDGAPSKRPRVEIAGNGFGELEDSKITGNERLSEIFEELGAIQRLKKDYFRARAYENVVEILRAHMEPILSGSQAKAIKGIGKGIATRIDEVLKTGQLQELVTLQRDDEDVVCLQELRQVPGISVVRAEELINRGIRSIVGLRQAVAAAQVQLDRTQSVGLAHVSDLQQQIPRPEMLEHDALLQRVRAERHAALTLLICGSYRRRKMTSGDIDILITSESFTSSNSGVGRGLLRDFVKSLRSAGYLVADLAFGEKKYMGVCRLPGNPLHRRIDIRSMPCDQFHFGTLYFTGSREHNVKMRVQALNRGLILCEHGLSKRATGEKIDVCSEEDIFRAVAMDYREPHER